MASEDLRILVEGDPHYKTSNLQEMKILESEIFRYLNSNDNIDLFVNLGDSLHTFRKTDLDPFLMCFKFMKKISSMKQTIMIIGNHDRKNNREFCSSNHFFHGLKKYGVTVVDKPRVVFVKKRPILCLPYVWKGDIDKLLKEKVKVSDQKDCVATVEEWISRAHLVLAHHDFKGRLEGNSVRSDGWDWKGPGLVISGHIHTYSFPQPKVCYIGTPMQENFGELNDKALGLVKLSSSGEKCFSVIGEDVYWSIERVFLNIPVKEVLKMSIKDLYSFEIPQNALISLKIKAFGTNAEKKGIIKSGIIEKLAQRSIIEFIETETNKVIQIPTTDDPVGEMNKSLFKLALSNPRKLKWFNRLYNDNAKPKITFCKI